MSRKITALIPAGLPEHCYVRIPGAEYGVGLVRRGESGYVPLDMMPHRVDELNRACGVTKGQAEAMLVGSMFGWHVPGADPARYDPATGCPLRKEATQGETGI